MIKTLNLLREGKTIDAIEHLNREIFKQHNIQKSNKSEYKLVGDYLKHTVKAKTIVDFNTVISTDEIYLCDGYSAVTVSSTFDYGVSQSEIKFSKFFNSRDVKYTPLKNINNVIGTLKIHKKIKTEYIKHLNAFLSVANALRILQFFANDNDIMISVNHLSNTPVQIISEQRKALILPCRCHSETIAPNLIP
jgi:hypothetical protein